MKYCENCGAPIGETARFCTQCGAPVKKEQSTATVQNKREENPGWYAPSHEASYEVRRERETPDSCAFGFGILGFFLPLVGLILFLAWQKNFPRRATGAGVGALVSVLLQLAIPVYFLIALFG